MFPFFIRWWFNRGDLIWDGWSENPVQCGFEVKSLDRISPFNSAVTVSFISAIPYYSFWVLLLISNRLPNVLVVKVVTFEYGVLFVRVFDRKNTIGLTFRDQFIILRLTILVIFMRLVPEKKTRINVDAWSYTTLISPQPCIDLISNYNKIVNEYLHT